MDTLAYAKRLEAAGIDRSQAEAHLEAMREHVMPHVASKSDIAELKAASKSDIAELRAATKTDVAELKAAMWQIALTIAGMNVAIASATVAIVKLL